MNREPTRLPRKFGVMARSLALSLALSLNACGPGSSPAPDSSVPTPDSAVPADTAPPPIEVTLEAVMPAAPAAPTAPQFTPCPERFREHSLGDGQTVCAPWAGPRPTCVAPAAPFVGAESCVVVGSSCPADGYPGGLPAAPEVLYVATTGTPGGAGTRLDPLDSVVAAVGRASMGTIIAVAVGTYEGAFELPAGVTIMGACASGTVLTSSTTEPTVRVTAANTALQNLQIRSASIGLSVEAASASVALSDLLIVETGGVGISVNGGGTVTGQRLGLLDGSDVALSIEAGRVALEIITFVGGRETAVRVSGTSSSATLTNASIVGVQSRDGASPAFGVKVDGGGELTLRSAVIEAVHGGGARIASSGRLLVDELVIRDLLGRAPGAPGGEGIVVVDDGHVEGTQLWVEGARRSAFRIQDEGSMVMADLLVGRTVGEEPDDVGGRGLTLRGNASVELDRAAFIENHEVGISAVGTVALTARDLTVSDTAPDALIGFRGLGIGASGGATLDIERAALDRNHEQGVLLAGMGTHFEGRDIAIRDTRGDSSGEGGRGLDVQDGASATITRVTIERSPQVAVLSVRGAHVTLTDAHLSEGLGDSAGHFGRGVEVQGAEVDLTRGIIDGAKDVALLSTGESRIILTDFTVTNTESRAVDGFFGRGIALQDAADARITRVRVDDYFDLGIFAAGRETRLLVDTLIIQGGRGRAPDGRFGRGLSLQSGVMATIESLRVEDAREVAVCVYGEGTVLSARNAIITSAREQLCAEDSCSDLALGVGLGIYAAAHVNLMGFEIDGSALAGIQLAPGFTADGDPAPSGGTADAADGRVTGSPVGANVQTRGFDLNRISERVIYLDNDTNLDSARLAVPAPAERF